MYLWHSMRIHTTQSLICKVSPHVSGFLSVNMSVWFNVSHLFHSQGLWHFELLLVNTAYMSLLWWIYCFYFVPLFPSTQPFFKKCNWKNFPFIYRTRLNKTETWVCLRSPSLTFYDSSPAQQASSPSTPSFSVEWLACPSPVGPWHSSGHPWSVNTCFFFLFQDEGVN